ncbi:MAG: hypothetical protein ACRDQU_01585 [Pseudonocardiaceae bacterium]
MLSLTVVRHPQEDSDAWRRRAPWLRNEVERLLGEDISGAEPHGGSRKAGQGSGTTLTGERGSDYFTARLKRDDPELAARVVNGEITPSAAARAKGWRKPRIVMIYELVTESSASRGQAPPARRRRRLPRPNRREVRRTRPGRSGFRILVAVVEPTGRRE